VEVLLVDGHHHPVVEVLSAQLSVANGLHLSGPLSALLVRQQQSLARAAIQVEGEHDLGTSRQPRKRCGCCRLAVMQHGNQERASLDWLQL
jgi:hypothetical protein